MNFNLGITGVIPSLVSLGYQVSSVINSSSFLQECSVFLHLVLLFGVAFSWVYKVLRRSPNENPKELNFRLDRPVLYSSLAFSLYNLGFFTLSCFYGFKYGWTDENPLTVVDLAFRALSWCLLSLYLGSRFHFSNDSKYPLLLRIWWCLYLAFSFYGIVVDIVQCREKCPPIPLIVSHATNVVLGIFFCCFGNLRKVVVRVDNSLQGPLLEGINNIESSVHAESKIVTPYSKANILSMLTFSWMGSLISKGFKKTLDLEDLPPLLGQDDVSESYTSFRNSLESSMDGSGRKITTAQLVKSLSITVWADILWTALICLLYTLSSYVGPYLIDTFVQYLSGKEKFKYEGYLLVSAFFVGKVVECLSEIQWFFRVRVVGIRIKSVLMESIYSKALTLSSRSKQGHSSGEIINLMSVDADRVGEFCWYMHDPWAILLQLVLALFILYKSVGLASIAGFIATLLVMLVNYPFSVLLEKYQGKLMEAKDRRMNATSEVLRNMRILKLQAWEMKFLSKIVELRNSEIWWLKKLLYASAVTNFVLWGAPTFVSVITFGACMMMGIPLESGKILAALATFKILQEPIYKLPDTISTIIQTKVSIDRIALFLSLDDLELHSVERLPRDISEVAIEISEGNFTWDDPSASSSTLKDINLRIHRGMRVAICGTVGSGKSTLLSCILGEVPKISGVLQLSGSKAYVPQSPWIQSGKIVDNILFGEDMDHARYDRVLEACSLKKDLEILPHGDQTIIGERGINLSGGQKQRVQIARALYQDADIYLFDDPFSAVDAHTGSHIFKECLLGLLESKTVIYVTHQMEFLPAADLILVMKDGRILQAGKYDDILNSGKDFKELLGAHEQALSALDSIEREEAKPKIITEEFGEKAVSDRNELAQCDKPYEIAGPVGQLVQEEERKKGRVGFAVYWKFITTAYGGALVPFILLSQVLFQLLQISSNYWMAWASPISAEAEAEVDEKILIAVYTALSIGSAFCVLARATLLVTTAYKTATLLFTKMHNCIFRAPMSFFDATPSGRILNRASTDQRDVDMTITYLVSSFALTAIKLIGTIVVMSQVAWQVFLIFIPVVAISLWYQWYYLPSARELTRLSGVCKAPVIQHFSETIAGAMTIRSFDQETRFYRTSLELINGFALPNFYSAAAMQWLCFRVDMLSVVTFVCSLIFLVSIPVGLIDPGIAGLAVTYGINLDKLQAGLIWSLCNMENKIISFERILQYSCIPSEAPPVLEENRPDKSWPSGGQVDVQDLQVRYAPHMPLVLRGITCSFQGGKKTGIVGRTGSGKSTLIQALFRLVEPAAGKIVIDGVNISSIGLHDLRSRLSIIPQDPTMFDGTIRSNLDPLEEHTDEQIWEALNKCQLADEVRKKEGKLDSIVSENGENWSMGQRQLVCLGRVLLKRSKVLVLDEATASVDTATDNMIQQTLKEHFSDSTVITIAHRITSVIHSDMVVVLSDGLVEECDYPSSLLENKSSTFSKLVAEYCTRANSRS